MKLLALDPGIRGCGAALFAEGRLVACDYVKNPVTVGNRAHEARTMASAVVAWAGFPEPDEVIAEYPQVYTVAFSKGDNNDLLALAGVDGALAALYPTTHFETYLPREWKQTMSKGVCASRVLRRLDPDELATLQKAAAKLRVTDIPALIKKDPEGKHLLFNALDAVGIGLKHVGRFEPRHSWEAA